MMTPCQKTLCENGEALFSVVLGLETFGFGGSMAKVNQYMIANGGYNADCSVNWAVMNGLNFAHFDSETTTAGYFQLCSWARRHYIVVAKYHDANHTARAGLVVSPERLFSLPHPSPQCVSSNIKKKEKRKELHRVRLFSRWSVFFLFLQKCVLLK